MVKSIREFGKMKFYDVIEAGETKVFWAGIMIINGRVHSIREFVGAIVDGEVVIEAEAVKDVEYVEVTNGKETFIWK